MEPHQTLRRAQWNGGRRWQSDHADLAAGKQLLGQRDSQSLQQLDKDGNPTDPVMPILNVTLTRE